MKKFFALLAMMLVAIGIQAQDSDFYYWKFNFKPGNTITFSDGSTITANGNPEAKYSRGGTVSYSGFSFPSILLPDGDQNTFTAPEGMLVSRIAFYSYVNANKADVEGDCYWKEVGGVEYADAKASGGAMVGFVDNGKYDLRYFSIPTPQKTVTFTTKGGQFGVIILAEYVNDEGTDPDFVTLNFNLMTNLPVSTNDSHDGDINEDQTFGGANGISLTVSPSGVATPNRLWGVNATLPDGSTLIVPQLRVYGGTIKLSSERRKILSAQFEVTGDKFDLTPNKGELTGLTWNGDAKDIVFTVNAQSRISSIAITLGEAEEKIPLAISCNDKGTVLINDAFKFTADLGEVDVLKGGSNTFVFTPNKKCQLEQVLLDGLDVTLSVKENILTTRIREDSKMIVTFKRAGSDVNGDGRLDISDVVAIVNEILGQ